MESANPPSHVDHDEDHDVDDDIGHVDDENDDGHDDGDGNHYGCDDNDSTNASYTDVDIDDKYHFGCQIISYKIPNI